MRKQYKIPNYIREYIKNELYQYWDNCKELEEIRQDIMDESPSPIDGQPKGSGIGKPTEKKAIKITEQMSTKRILKAEKNMQGIKRAFARLAKEEMEVVELIFKEGKSQIYAQMNYGISKDTYYNTMN